MVNKWLTQPQIFDISLLWQSDCTGILRLSQLDSAILLVPYQPRAYRRANARFGCGRLSLSV